MTLPGHQRLGASVPQSHKQLLPQPSPDVPGHHGVGTMDAQPSYRSTQGERLGDPTNNFLLSTGIPPEIQPQTITL